MNAETLDAEKLRELLEAVAAELEGDWLIVGGGLVSLWLDGRRTTEDLDLIGMQATTEQRYRLLEFVVRRGLEAETVNSAADYFVHRIPDWRNQVEVFLRGKRSTIFRPTPTLFLLLKVGRMSEQDLADCRVLLGACARSGWSVDVARVRTALTESRADAGSGASERRRQLARWLADFGA